MRDGGILVCVGASNVQLRDGTFGGRGTQGLQGGGHAVGLVGEEVGLGADAVDGHAGGDPLLDFGDHAFRFGVVDAVFDGAVGEIVSY